jgi:hypothetical protein
MGSLLQDLGLFFLHPTVGVKFLSPSHLEAISKPQYEQKAHLAAPLTGRPKRYEEAGSTERPAIKNDYNSI